MRHNKTVYVAASTIDGRGLFTLRSIQADTRIIEYIGAKISTNVADTLKTRFLFDLENDWTIDGAGEENVARFVNHSCAPNCEARIEGERIFFYALREIVPHEEITIDYGKEYLDEFIQPTGCRCLTCNKKAASMASGLVCRKIQ